MGSRVATSYGRSGIRWAKIRVHSGFSYTSYNAVIIFTSAVENLHTSNDSSRSPVAKSIASPVSQCTRMPNRPIRKSVAYNFGSGLGWWYTSAYIIYNVNTYSKRRRKGTVYFWIHRSIRVGRWSGWKRAGEMLVINELRIRIRDNRSLFGKTNERTTLCVVGEPKRRTSAIHVHFFTARPW